MTGPKTGRSTPKADADPQDAPVLSPGVRARAERAERKHAARRAKIVAAATAVFVEKGLSAATMRAIAAEAGVTTGALYPYFSSKEELYAAALSRSLSALRRHVEAEIGAASARFGAAALGAFFDYYRARMEELSLGLHLYDGLGPSGLTRPLDRRLNQQLQTVFDAIEAALRDDGTAEPKARAAAGVAQAIGLLVMERTGRLKLFGLGAEALFAQHLQHALAPARPGGREDGPR